MSRGRLPSWGAEQFPGRRGERVGRTPLKRCVRCNTPNDTRLTAYSKEGDGLGAPEDTNVSDAKDRTVQSGCRFCGSLNWQDSKPTPLPDDRNLPSDEWRRFKRKRR